MQKAHDASKNNWWENLPSIATPIVAEELNRNETSVDAIDDRVVTFDTTKANQTDLLLAVKSISFDKNTGVFTITKFNNTSTTIDTDIEKIAINFDYDDDPTSPHYQHLVITLDDGTVKYIDMSALVTQYDFSDSAQIHFTNTSGTISATIINGSITEEKLQPNFLADCRAAKTAAETAEANAQSSEDEANAWANGEIDGVPVPSTHPAYHNNAKYYKDLANPTSLVALTDTDINYPKSGEVLTFNGDKWENREFFSSEDITVTDSFESYTGGRVKSLTMEVKPIQLFNGYDHPWVGGAGKNKYNPDNTLNAYIGSVGGGYAVRANADTRTIYAPCLPNTAYTISKTAGKRFSIGWTENLPADNVAVYNSASDNTASSMTITTGATAQYIVAYVWFGTYDTITADEMLASCQIESGSTATAYESYENICPIFKPALAIVKQRGKNLFDVNTYYSTTSRITIADNKINFENSNYSPAIYHLDLKQGTYTFSTNIALVSGSAYCKFRYLDEPSGNLGSISTSTSGIQTVTFTVARDETVYVEFCGASSTSTGSFANCQLELGSSATDYEPYQEKTYTINLGGTYYWLRGDVVSGKWYVVGKGKDVSTLTFRSASRNRWLSEGIISEVRHPSTSSVKIGFWSDSYYYTDAQSLYDDQTLIGIAVDNDGNLLCRNNDTNPPTGYIVYELATPIPINLDPQLIEAFLGENNFSAPLEQQEIIEIVARNIAEFNEVIDDENISDEFTYSSEKIEDRLDEYVDKDAVEEKSATDEFTTINGGLLSSLKVSLTPNQDLHGYDSPWVGGSKKNKINCNAPTVTNNGVTITNNGDGTFTATGTATGQTDFYLTNSGSSDLIPLGDITDGYLVNGCPSGGGTSSYQLVIGSLNSRYATDSGNGDTLTNVLQNGIRVILRVYSNYSFPTGGLTFEPMIRASGTSADFEPYSNICPISGHTQVEVEVGTNKLNPDNIVQGSLTTSAVSTRCSTRGNLTIPISVGQAITVSRQSSTINFAVAVTDSSMSVLFDSGWQSGSYTYVSAYDGYVELVFAKQDGTDITPSNVKSANFMVEFGSTPSPYVPYTKGTYSLTVNLGGTYYSGTLDVVSGVFVPDTAKQTYPWGTYTRTDDLGNTRRRILAILSDALGTVSSDIGANISDSVEEQTGWTTDSPHFYIDSSNKTLVVFLPISTSDSTNIEVCYKLATPTSIQLSPTMVKALVGENHLSAPLDGQEITESKYRELFTWDEVSGVTDSLDSRVDTLETNASKITWSSSVSKAIDDTTCTIQDPKITTSSIIEPFYSNVSGDNVVIKNQIATTGQVVLTFDALLEATSFRVRITNL